MNLIISKILLVVILFYSLIDCNIGHCNEFINQDSYFEVNEGSPNINNDNSILEKDSSIKNEMFRSKIIRAELEDLKHNDDLNHSCHFGHCALILTPLSKVSHISFAKKDKFLLEINADLLSITDKFRPPAV